MSAHLFSVETLEELAHALPCSNYLSICEALNKDYADNYRRFTIPKKNGGVRVIQAPQGEIKSVQEGINSMLTWIYMSYAPKAAHGLMKKRSIVSNALPHVQKQWVLNFDLRDFYVSITEKRVAGLFRAIPFCLPHWIADKLAKLTTTPIGLPQGGPSSPVIANMVAYQLDLSLTQLAKNYGYDYTRYADDITLSSNKPFAAKIVAFDTESNRYMLGDKLLAIVADCGFRVNLSKTRLQHCHERQVVTGLTVNDKPNVDRKYIRNLEGMIHAIQKYGIDAVLKFNAHYAKETMPLEMPFSVKIDYFINTLLGRLSFVKMVKGQDDPVYKRLIASIHQEAFSVDEPTRDSGKEIIQSLKAYLLVETAKHDPALHKNIPRFDTNDNFCKNFTGDKSAFTQKNALNLDGRDLTSLPECIAKYTKLTKLSLKNNRLTSLPDWIGLLTNLTELDLSNNQLSSLPETIANLTNLLDIDLGYNQLTSLPKSIANLTKLEKIKLCLNPLPRSEIDTLRRLVPKCEVLHDESDIPF